MTKSFINVVVDKLVLKGASIDLLYLMQNFKLSFKSAKCTLVISSFVG